MKQHSVYIRNRYIDYYHLSLQKVDFQMHAIKRNTVIVGTHVQNDSVLTGQDTNFLTFHTQNEPSAEPQCSRW